MKFATLFKNPIYAHKPSTALRRLVRSAYQPQRGELFSTDVPWGDRIETMFDEEMGRYLWLYGCYDLPVCEVISRLLKKDNIAVDVGANAGIVSTLMSACVGPKGSVYAFEPHPTIFDLLKRNVAQNGYADRTSCKNCAVSDQVGSIFLSVPEDHEANIGTAHVSSSGGAGGKSCQATTLDEQFAENSTVINLLKIDTEGHEPEVLRGANKILSSGSVQTVVFEDENSPGSESKRILTDLSFDIHAICPVMKTGEPLLLPLNESAAAFNFLAVRKETDISSLETSGALTVYTMSGSS